MELWIRSQAKGLLLKINNIGLQEETNSIVTQQQDLLFNLGTYKSEERALKVLDEISDLLNGGKIRCVLKVNGFLSNDALEKAELRIKKKFGNDFTIVNNGTDIIPLSKSLVFEMPKE